MHRVVFVTRKFPPSVGGMETLAAGVWRTLHAADPDSLLVAHGGSNRALPWWLPFATLRTAWLVTTGRAEMVLAGDALTYAVLRPLLAALRVPEATMVMGKDITWSPRAYRALVHRALRRAPAVLAISEATAASARGFGVPPERVHVVRLGVDAPTTSAADRAAARSRLLRDHDLPDDAVILLTLGRLVRRKGASWFVDQVLPRLPAPVVHLVAGDGEEMPALRRAAASGPAAGRLVLLGRVDDDARETLMAGADLFVQPNVRVAGDMEGFGLVVIEAALRGTPVVASALEGILDAVVDGVTGLLLPAEDAEAWVARLTALVAGPDARASLAMLGARFRTAAADRYSEAEMGRRLLAVLSGVGREVVYAAQGSDEPPDPGGNVADSRRKQLAYSDIQHKMLIEDERRAKAAKIIAVLRDFLGRDDLAGLSVLDLGCSAGFIADEMHTAGAAHVYGADIDEPGLEKARSRFGDHVEFVCADGEALPWPDGSMDVVVYNHIYEHVVDPDAVMGEIRRVLRPDGIVYLGLGNRYGVMEPHHRLPFLSWLPARAADRYMRWTGRGDSYHERFRSRRGLRRMAAGLTVWDYTDTVLAEPARFVATDLVPGPARRLPAVAWRALTPILPTYIWVGSPGNREPAGSPADRVVPPRRVTSDA